MYILNYFLIGYYAKVVNLNPTHGKVYSIQHYVIKFVNDLRQDDVVLWMFLFPLPVKLKTTR
jgi:hypothetical protein